MSDTITRRGIIEGGGAVRSNTDAKEVTIIEHNDQSSLSNMIPEKLKFRLKEIPAKLFGMSEVQLAKSLKPDQTDESLRLAFWDEYTVAVDARRNMKVSNVYRGICSKEFFYVTIVPNDLRLAYILKPPIEYTFKMRDLLELGHRRMREILEMDLIDQRGNPNTRLIAEVVKIVALVENRVRGAVVHKVQMEQKNLNINVDAPKDYFEISDELKNIEREIKQLEAGSDGVSSDAEASDIEAKEIEVTSGSRVDEGGSSAPIRAEVLQVAEEVFRVEE